MEFVYYTADVFTDKRFCGNQLAVVLNAEGLSSWKCKLLLVSLIFQKPFSLFLLGIAATLSG